MKRQSKFTDHFERGDGCWLWTGAKDGCGYGRYGNDAAHRFSFALHKHEIEPGLCVMHTCDEPSCVNPDHLTLGTQADNMRDMASKGRGRKPVIGGSNMTRKWRPDHDPYTTTLVGNIDRAMSVKRMNITQMCEGAGITTEAWRLIRKGGDIKLGTLSCIAFALDTTIAKLVKGL
jgi:DNA-binding Xre family transcriptional regulator